MAHELRNPLAPMRHALQILELAEDDARRRGKARAMLERQVLHMARLVDDLLDVSRITRGKVRLRREHLDLARLVQTAAEDRRRMLEEAGLAPSVGVPAEPVWVEGDPTRLTQVVSNLLDNAAKFTDRGGGAAVAVARDGAAGQ